MKKHIVQLHNEMVGPIVRSICKPVMDAGGDEIDVMVVLESVVAGVLVAIIKDEGGDDRVIETLAKGVKPRMRDIREGVRKKRN